MYNQDQVLHGLLHADFIGFRYYIYQNVAVISMLLMMTCRFKLEFKQVDLSQNEASDIFN